MKADFSGYATKAGLKCSDGLTIMPDAFKHQDQMRVPLVWQHGHAEPENVLGHAILENRTDGVYAYGFFNDSARAVHTKGLVEHRDITMLSIWANQLIKRGGQVLHGAIREVSLVLAGANPGALIENVTIRHSDGETSVLDDEVIIYTGCELEHADADDGNKDKEEKTVKHADGEDDPDDKEDVDDETTVKDIYDSMTDEQKEVVHFMLGEAIESAKSSVKQDSLTDKTNDETKDQEGSTMTHNVFEQGKETPTLTHTLTHADVKGIVADAMKNGSLKEAVENYALAHGINDIDMLFPEAHAVTDVPEWIKRRTEWVSEFLGATRKSPFSRIKTLSADLTHEEARAKGYVKGTLKKEEFFGIAFRVTTPATVYKKQKLDRDDIVDITDFDVVAWLKAEMRIMLDEEIARAGLIGDGRDVSHEDKISETNIRPIAKDHELYTTTVTVNIDDASSSIQEFIDAVITNRHMYKGTGTPNLYTTETYISRFMLLKDSLGRRIYNNLSEVAAELRVNSIIPVEVMEDEPDVIAIMVNPVDYVMGATRGGQVSMFDDFDIDYNQYKYLIETRLCGALVKVKSAIVFKKTAGANVLVAPNEPAFDPELGEVTITDQTGVVYKDGAGTTINAAGSPYTVTPGTPYVVNATPASGYYFATSEDDSWTYEVEA